MLAAALIIITNVTFAVEGCGDSASSPKPARVP
jgi:hypothetical protein